MKYVIYIDVFWTVNFFMDYMIISVVAKLAKPQTTKVRKIFAAMEGATLSCMVLVMKDNYVLMQKIITYVIIPVLMILSCFGRKAKIKIIFLMYGVTFLFSGITEFMYRSFFGSVNPEIKRFAGITFTAYILVDLFFEKVCKKKSEAENKNDLYNVKIHAYGKCMEIKALYDSGNSLNEPISGKSVHVVEKEEIKKLLEGVEAYKIKIRMVPYRCIGRENGMMTAVCVSDVEIEFDEEVIKTGEAYLGIYEGRLANNKAYRMILNRSIKKWL